MEMETIVALATPPGRGAISIVRLSGPRTRELLRAQFQANRSGEMPARRPLLGRFLDGDGQVLDRVLVTFFPRPHSYTGEDVGEVSCHGSPLLARRIVETLLRAGARLARPGEFTLRAFLNGKMDLAQAEAVRDLVQSQTAFQARIAAEQLGGKLSQTLQPLKQELVKILCHMETCLEFVEEKVEPEGRERLLEGLQRVDDRLRELEESFQLGHLVQAGITVAICGRPNSGKSSLFNSLIREDRAIVTALPGTTRDALTESIDLEGVPTRLVDTAGIREATELVETLGVKKSLEYLKQSDAVLFVVDGSEPWGEEDVRVWASIREKRSLLVVNKCDLAERVRIPAEISQACAGTVRVSALHGTHLDRLRRALWRLVAPEEALETERLLVTNLRHQRCIELARGHLASGMKAYREGLSEEFPLYDFRRALDALAEITGETTVEDILEQIFSTFCIGK